MTLCLLLLFSMLVTLSAGALYYVCLLYTLTLPTKLEV